MRNYTDFKKVILSGYFPSLSRYPFNFSNAKMDIPPLIRDCTTSFLSKETCFKLNCQTVHLFPG